MKYQEREVRIPELEKLPDVKSRYWSKEEIEIVRKYLNKDLREVAKYLNRSYQGVKQIARRIRGEQDDAGL